MKRIVVTQEEMASVRRALWIVIFILALITGILSANTFHSIGQGFLWFGITMAIGSLLVLYVLPK